MKSFLKIFLATLLVVALVAAVGVTKASKYSWLGVQTETVDKEVARDRDLSVKSGVAIEFVYDDSPAEDVGLEEDDVIIAVNGTKIEHSDDLQDIIDDHQPGDKITLRVVRDGKEKDLEVTLDSRPRHSRRWKGKGYYAVPPVPPVPPIPRIVVPHSGHYAGYFRGGSYIGVLVTDLTRQLGEQYGVKGSRGALVMDVDKKSPAEEAGILAGDVIVSIDKEKIADASDVSDVIGDFDEGDTVEVVVVRDKKEQNFKVVVGESNDRSHRTKYYLSGRDLDIDIPNVQFYGQGNYSDAYDLYFNSEEFEEEMEDLADELRDMEDDLKDLQQDRDEELKDQLEELRDRIRDIREELD